MDPEKLRRINAARSQRNAERMAHSGRMWAILKTGKPLPLADFLETQRVLCEVIEEIESMVALYLEVVPDCEFREEAIHQLMDNKRDLELLLEEIDSR